MRNLKQKRKREGVRKKEMKKGDKNIELLRKKNIDEI